MKPTSADEFNALAQIREANGCSMTCHCRDCHRLEGKFESNYLPLKQIYGNRINAFGWQILRNHLGLAGLLVHIEELQRMNEPTTHCDNCGAEVPVSETHSCEKCGRDPLCPMCVCENCPEAEKS